MTGKAARDALLAFAVELESRQGPERDDATVVWAMAAKLARERAASIPHPQLDGETVRQDGGEARRGRQALNVTREELGRVVRETWVAWARRQPNPKPSWLVPWSGLTAPEREVDMLIGEAVAAAVREHTIKAVAGVLREEP